MIVPGYHILSAEILDARGYPLIVGGNHHSGEHLDGPGPFHHMLNHRFPGDQGKRFPAKPIRLITSRYYGNNIWFLDWHGKLYGYFD